MVLRAVHYARHKEDGRSGEKANSRNDRATDDDDMPTGANRKPLVHASTVCAKDQNQFERLQTQFDRLQPSRAERVVLDRRSIGQRAERNTLIVAIVLEL